jgi:hypothetical protein
MTIHETISLPRKEIISNVLNEQNVAARTIVDILYGILLAKITEGPATEDAYDVSRLLTYSLNRCVDPTREVEHQHPLRNFNIHKRITNEVHDHEFKLTFNRLADILVWLMHPEQVTMTAMEFYTTVPGLFLLNMQDMSWVDEFVKKDKFTSELIHKITLRADIVTIYPPRVDMEMDKLKWLHEFTKVAKKLDIKLQQMTTEAWTVYATRCMMMTSLLMALTTIHRSSSIELMSGCAALPYNTLRSQSSKVVYSRTQKIKG